MRLTALPAVLLAVSALALSASACTRAASAPTGAVRIGTAAQIPIAQLLNEVPLIDGHNDLIIHFVDWGTGKTMPPEGYDIRKPTMGQSDLPRMRKGQLGAAIFTIWTSDDANPKPGLEESIGLFRTLAAQNPGDLAVVTSPDELISAHAAGKIAIMMGVEGGNPVEGDLGLLGWMRDHGVVEMGLVWSTNGLGTAGRTKAEPQGLTDLGRNAVVEMNRLGLIIDLSHASNATVRDTVALSRVPVIDTHAIAARFSSGEEHLTADSMKAIASGGGLVMPMFIPESMDPAYFAWGKRRDAHFTEVAVRLMGEEGKNQIAFLPWPDAIAKEMEPWFAENPPPKLDIGNVADVYDHVRSIVGIDHIGIGSDFDGMGFHPSNQHPAMRDVSYLPALLEELRRRGWSDEDLKKLAGLNFLRVWRAIRAGAG